MNHVWHTRILVSCIAIAAVIDAGEEALSRAPHVVAKLPDLWWLHYAPLSLLSIAAILWIVRLLQNWTSPNIKPQAQTQPLKPAIELAPSKLRIHSASYAPIDGEGDDYPVAEFLSQITNGDSLVLDNIQNQSFQTPSHNFVPKDPKVGTKKRLLVEYSFGNEKTTTIERREESRIVLPEDPFLKVFNLLQLRAFHLAGRLRAFSEKMGPRPDADWATGDKSNPADWMAMKIAERRGIQKPWFSRLKHRYEKEFSHDITEIMHDFGETGLDVGLLVPHSSTVSTEHDVRQVANTLDSLAIELNHPNIQPPDLDDDTIAKYNAMGSSEMKNLLQHFPDAGKAVDEAYARKGVGGDAS